MNLTLARLKSLVDKFSFISGNTKNSFNDNRQLNIHIHLPKKKEISKKHIAEVSKTIREVLVQTKKEFLGTTKQSQSNLRLVDGYSKDDKDEEIRKFIRERLPRKDSSIWYSALILREQFSRGEKEEVNRLKGEMSISNPGRGGNIANLCTAGYLESHIKPLYEFLVGEKGNEQLFQEIYETIVIEFPFAVFVSTERNFKDVHNEVKTKINLVKKYGWKKVSVHGIGESNVKMIMKIAIEIQGKSKKIKGVDYSSFESQGKIITVAFNLK